MTHLTKMQWIPYDLFFFSVFAVMIDKNMIDVSKSFSTSTIFMCGEWKASQLINTSFKKVLDVETQEQESSISLKKCVCLPVCVEPLISPQWFWMSFDYVWTRKMKNILNLIQQIILIANLLEFLDRNKKWTSLIIFMWQIIATISHSLINSLFLTMRWI